jgi:hypothetical protein
MSDVIWNLNEKPYGRRIMHAADDSEINIWAWLDCATSPARAVRSVCCVSLFIAEPRADLRGGGQGGHGPPQDAKSHRTSGI